jgi:HD-GYP domain-containing protein (c-di-GMP phosphodiesterase class II)
MKKVSVNQLEEQTYIDAPVYLDGKFILLSPEIFVYPELIERLKKWKFDQVYTNGLPTQAPPLANGTTSLPGESILDQDIKENDAKEKARAFFNKSIKVLDEVFTDFQIKGELYEGPIIELAKNIMAEVKTNKQYLLSLEQGDEESEYYIVPHSIRTALYASAIADFLKLPPHKQIDVGTTALLHEIGMLRIPPEIYQHDRVLTDKERQTIAAHPVISYKVLKEAGFPSNICVGVLEHHEYINGMGYPRKLTGESISLYGRIVGVASAYSAATSKRLFREGHDGHTTIMDLAKDMGKRYDERILRALIFTLSIYPIGTYVMLSNGAVGIIVQTDPKQPKHPIVRLLINENNNPYRDRPTIQPQDNDEVVIERPLSKTEVNELKEYLSHG